MCTETQRFLLVIHIKNKLRGKAAQLISSRNPNSYLEIKQLLNLHFGDSRDLTSLIQDLQRLRQLSNESPLTYFNRLQVLNAKMQANINKSNQSNEQKKAQTDLIETMALNTLLTGLDPRIGQIVRASNPKDLLEAHQRIRRELQLSYFENQQKTAFKPNQPKLPQHTVRKPFQNSPQRFSTQNYTPRVNPNFTPRFTPNQNQNQPQSTNQFTPKFNPNFNNQPQQFQSNRPNFNSQPNQFQSRPSVIQRNPNFNSNQQHRAHGINYETPNYTEEFSSHEEYPDNYYDCYYDDQPYEFEYNQTPETLSFEDPMPSEIYEDFLKIPAQDKPPANTRSPDTLTKLQSQIQNMNLCESKTPEQTFM